MEEAVEEAGVEEFGEEVLFGFGVLEFGGDADLEEETDGLETDSYIVRVELGQELHVTIPEFIDMLQYFLVIGADHLLA